ncbi:hypothetical protein [Xanthomonas campestris]|uniref:hypothetical protein n=1 Tax=Xanthomonas TaxID=338 RepID=UPI001E3ABE5A|nr:hypothetical protein [Xanthomonas campestris]MCC5090076.1 hypothetical protein [Xanthomonas campestris]
MIWRSGIDIHGGAQPVYPPDFRRPNLTNNAVGFPPRVRWNADTRGRFSALLSGNF